MSGKHITDQQVRLFMGYKQKGSTQVQAAAKAGISERSGRRIDKRQLQPGNREPRHWRTRKDPLEPVWDSIVLPLLQRDARLTPVGIFDHLCEHHADKFSPRSRRTLERRITHWRHLHGHAKEVIFRQAHADGEWGFVDFTRINADDFVVTIQGKALSHQLFHYRLPASGWAFAQVVYGGESFVAFSESLQNALCAAGGVPQKLRTDSLAACFKNRANAITQEDLTERYDALAQHYGFAITRNNKGVSHENGAIESAHRHLKARLSQALKVRGSADFESREAYEAFVQHIMTRQNRRISDNYLVEQRQLQPLPTHRSAHYSEHYVSVSRTSTFTLKRVTYSVPSRLIGACLLIRAYDKHLELLLGSDKLLDIPRVYASTAQRARRVDYRHLIDSLVKKPRSFRNSQLRDDLLPSTDYAAIWQYVDEQLALDDACRYIVKLLHIAAQADCEAALGRFVMAGISQRQLPAISACEKRFLKVVPIAPSLTVEQHSLAAYQELLGVEHG